MITSLGKQAAVATAVVTFGGLNVIAAQAPAQASAFSASYTCSVPVMGPRTAVLDGRLASPGRTVVNNPTGFRLHIARLSLTSPVAINSWSASAWIDVTGAENTSFRLTGSGGFVPPRQPISGDLVGSWAPAAYGTDLMSVSSITITANTAATGNVTVECTPNAPRPVAETLMVSPLQVQPVWPRPVVVAPPYHHHHHHGWTRPVGPGHHHHNHPVVVRPPVRPPHHHPVVVRPPVRPPHHHPVVVRPGIGPQHNHPVVSRPVVVRPRHPLGGR